MPELGVVEDTLFVPMLGRIYASEHCQRILYDEKALSLKEKLPDGLLEREMKGQSEYTLLASASRSANMDRYIKDFLKRKPNGVIVQLGCGLETTFYRDDNGKTHWYGGGGFAECDGVQKVDIARIGTGKIYCGNCF